MALESAIGTEFTKTNEVAAPGRSASEHSQIHFTTQSRDTSLLRRTLTKPNSFVPIE